MQQVKKGVKNNESSHNNILCDSTCAVDCHDCFVSDQRTRSLSEHTAIHVDA